MEIPIIGQELSFKSIPTSFSIEHYPYTVLKIIPYKTSYSDKQFERILNTLHKYNNTFWGRFELRKSERQLVYHPKQSLCYEVLFTQGKVSYHYVIPNIYKNMFINKVKFLLEKCDIVEMPDYLHEFKGGYKQKIVPQKNWMFALNTNKDINFNDSLLVLNKDLQNMGDKLLLQYILQPQWDWEWKDKWQQRFNKYAQTGVLKGSINFYDLLSEAMDFVIYQFDLMINAIFGEEITRAEKEKINFASELSDATKKKSIFDGFKTNINLYIKTQENLTAENISRNVSTILKDLDGNNSLKMGRAKKVKQPKLSIKHRYIKYYNPQRDIKRGFITNTQEAPQFIKTPSEKMMKEYEEILDKINVAETEMPSDLFDRGILLGEMKKGSVYRQITFGTHKDSNSKPLVFIAPQEGGKTTFAINYAVSAIEQGHSVFVFDTIDGKIMRNVRDYLVRSYPEEKIVVLDFANDEYILPLLWNEVTDIYLERLENAKTDIEKYRVMEEFSSAISSELQAFMDTLQEDFRDQRLTNKMRTILNQLTQLVFMNKGTIGMVKECLYNIELRHKLIKNLNLPKQLSIVKDIMRVNEEGESTTIKGIESRLNKLMENTEVEKYFSVQTDKKLDFAKWANEGCAVIINVPEHKFKSAINPVVTFLVQKLWLAITSSRYNIDENDRCQTHLLIDEPNKFPMVMDLLKDTIIASRKWRLRFIFMIHNINIFHRMQENLKSAGTSFIVIPPTSEHNFYGVKEFYEPFTTTELKETEKLTAKYNGKFKFALCSIHYKNANYPCVVKLPLPVEKRYKKIDRSYLNKKWAKELGVSQIEYYEKLFKVQTEENKKEVAINL